MSYVMHLADGRMTADEFLEWHQYQEERYELIAGIPVRMMAGAKRAHNVLATNIVVALSAPARAAGCQVMSSDMAVRINDRQIRYPDIVVDCGPGDPDDLNADRPALIVEIASRSTTALDHSDKLEEYRSIESIRYVLLIDPNVVDAKLYTRTEEGWTITRYGGVDDTIPLPILGTKLALADVYATLNPADPPRLQLLDKT